MFSNVITSASPKTKVIYMILYDFFQASGMKPAKFVAVTLTSLQILQMIVGIFINWYTWKELSMT